ncbi:HAD-IB family hydrolase [Saccharothrix violaceirubra]|uniref:HAD superfamily hydrolase (TIGR01490 family) n=1 Tax=Saccharothrix violaceirubra TaxID=413306 RepID=A0A7W7WW06_9PSEU|nr:HAD superfamily hydrolase (TIGR01490 family) [Saccharothrix violaceirubra]
MSTRNAAAFFDVDDTLIRGNSMAGFLRHHLGSDDAVAAVAARLAGLPRAQANRAYFRLFAGVRADLLAARGREWFDPGLLRPDTLEALRRHANAGEPVFLVSGSFFACLDPIAEAVGATRAFGTRPVVRGGVLTGEVLAPMLDGVKAEVVRLTAAVLGVDLGRCSAYGDHATDLPMLRLVGHPVVVGDDPVLTSWARGRGRAAGGPGGGRVRTPTGARAAIGGTPGPATGAAVRPRPG